MAQVIHEIIILDDDDDDDEEEEKPHCSTAQRSPQRPLPATNGKKGSCDGSKKSTVYTVQNNKLFEEFVNYCSKLTVEHPEVITFLKGRFSKANPSFLSSVEFHNVLGRCLTKVQSKRSKVYVYINELCTALKANSQKRKVTLQASTSSKPVQEDPEKADKTTEADAEEDNSTSKKTGSKRQIRYLENLLRIYSREIQKLQEKELSLDELEDEDSSYIQEARLKRKILRIFQKLCDLKDCSSLTGRVIEQKIPYRGTRYPEVNRRLEKFINGSHDIFPDYNDVLRVILKANDKHSLGLPRKQMQGMAQDAFRELGNRLQERRHLDLVYNFGCHLTDSYKPGNDPAHQDSSLQRRLRDNRSVAVDRLDDLIKKYVDMQDVGEEEERKKRKKNSEAQNNSPKTSSRPTPSPSSPESEDEEESEESETDIEDLMNSQEIADGEGKEEEEEEEEEEHPVDQEHEADQRMENCSDPQPFSSAGEEENEDKNEEVDSEMEEGTEEPVEPSTTTDSSPQTNREEGKSTSLELEIEFVTFDRSPCSLGEETSPHSSMDTQNGEFKEVDSMESKSEDINTRDDTESHALKVYDKTAEIVDEDAECNLTEHTRVKEGDPMDVEEVDPADVEEVDPADVEEVDPKDVEEVDPADVEEVDPADVEEVDPADVEEVDPADVEEVDPADVEEVDPADVGEVDPAGVGQVDPAGVGQVDPAGVEAVDPAGVEAVDPAGVQEVDPAGVEEVDPAGVEEVDPAGVEEVDPAGVEEVDPAGVEEVDPAGVEEVDPAGVGEVDPAGVGEVDPAGVGEVDPAGVGEVDPAGVGEVDPAGVGEVDPAGVGEVDPAGVGEVDPAGVGEVDPAGVVAGDRAGVVAGDRAGVVAGDRAGVVAGDRAGVVAGDRAGVVAVDRAGVEEVDPAGVEEVDPAGVEEVDPAGVEEVDPAGVEDRDSSADVNVADVEDDLQADGECSSLGNVEADDVSKVTSKLEDAESLEGDQLDSCIQKESTSFRETTTPAVRDKVLIQSRQVDAEIRCVESPVHTGKIASCTESKLLTRSSPFGQKTTGTNIEVQCNKSHAKADSPASHDSLFIDSGDENDMNEDPEGSRVGSINGVDHVTGEEQDITGSPIRSNPTNKDCITDTIKSKWTKDPIPPSKKRKRSPSQILLKNGKRVLNGSGQDGEKMKKARKECYYASPLPNISDKTNEDTPDITLAMVVTCSPPSSPSSKGTPRRMANVSTQCDPDEVIVLSD